MSVLAAEGPARKCIQKSNGAKQKACSPIQIVLLFRFFFLLSNLFVPGQFWELFGSLYRNVVKHGDIESIVI